MKVKGTDFPFALDRSSLRFRKLLKGRKRKMANYRQVVRRMVLSDAGMVFVEGYIQTIMEAILNSPMLSPGVGKNIHALQ